jgi:hypothetical protein
VLLEASLQKAELGLPIGGKEDVVVLGIVVNVPPDELHE